MTQAEDSMNISLTSGADIILFTAELNLCKKLLKPSFCPCIILLNDSDIFPDSSNMFQEHKVAKCLASRCDYQINGAFANQHIGLHQNLSLEI